MNTRRSGVIGLSALLACAGFAAADILTFQPSSGDFHDEDNWLHSENNTGVPTHDDRIVIPDQKICDVVANGQVVSFTIDTMNIASGGTLNIDAGITLILQNDDDNIPSLGSDDHSKVDGTLNVGHQTNGGGTLVVKAMNDPEHVFAGNGTMLGLHADSLIQVGEDDEFTSVLGASGSGGILNWFTIEAESGTATFNNEGRLIADDFTGIVLESSLILTDVAGAIWGLDHCDSTMTFRRAADLDGDVVFFGHDGSTKDGGGILIFDVVDGTVSTSGTHVIQNECPRSEWQFADGATFVYLAFDCSLTPATCATCGNPCDECAGPFVVDTDKSSDPYGNCIVP